jgi:hypothetical protein
MELEEKLFKAVIAKRGITLSSVDAEKFSFACEKSIPENPGASYEDLLLVCNIYLDFILSSPTIDLGEIKSPENR